MRAIVLKFLIKLLALLPLRINHLLGGGVGFFNLISNSRSKKIAEKNINYCFPQKSANWKKKLLKETLVETAKGFTELGPFWLWDSDKLMSLIVDEKNREILDKAISKNKGSIIVAPHFGAWELAGIKYCSVQPMTILYSQPKMIALDKLMIRARGRYGATLAPANTRGIIQLTKVLKKGKMIGILPDQTPKDGNGILSSFFGHPCYTMTLISKIAQKTGATIIFSCLERLPKGEGFIMHYLKPPKMIYSENLQESVDALNLMTEKVANINLSQYLWAYKRFKKIDAKQIDIY